MVFVSDKGRMPRKKGFCRPAVKRGGTTGARARPRGFDAKFRQDGGAFFAAISRFGAQITAKKKVLTYDAYFL